MICKCINSDVLNHKPHRIHGDEFGIFADPGLSTPIGDSRGEKLEIRGGKQTTEMPWKIPRQKWVVS